MDSYYMSICPGCKKLFKTKNNGKAIKCPKCQDTLLISIGFTEEEWKTKSKTDKDVLIDKILNKAKIQETSQPQKVDEKKANIRANDYSDFFGVSSTEGNELNTKNSTNHSSFFEGFEPQNDFGAVPTPATQQISHNSNTANDSNISSQSNNVVQKHSGLSIGAFITSFFACLSIFGIILGIYDLAKGDPKKKHSFSIAAIIIGAVVTISTVIGSISAVGFSSNNTTSNENVESVTEKSLSDIAEASQDEYLDDNQSDIISAETSEQSDESDNVSYKPEDTESTDNDANIEDSTDTSIARNMDDSAPADVSTQESEPEPTLTIMDTVIATHLVNVREEPNTKCNILGEVNEGEKVDRYESMSNGWSKVSFAGNIAYINSKYLASEKEYAALKERQAQESEAVATNDSASGAPEQASARTNASNDTSSSSGGNGGNANNFDTYDIPEQQNTSDQWVLNTNTMKIHHPSCKSVKKIKPSNYATSNLSLSELQSQGYSLCGNCF